MISLCAVISLGSSAANDLLFWAIEQKELQ